MGRTLKLRRQDFRIPAQYEFISDNTTPFIVYMGGMGAGKSSALLLDSFCKHLTAIDPKNGKSFGIITYPTYKIADDVFVPEFARLLDQYGIKYKYNIQQHKFVSDYGKIAIYPMDPAVIVGSSATFLMSDELDTLPHHKAEAVFNKMIGRARGMDGVQYAIGTTPEGYAFIYNEFYVKTPEEMATEGKRLIISKTTDNPYLPKSYIENMLRSYDPKMVEQYINGIPQNLSSGVVYYSYREDNHMLMDFPLPDSIHVGVDFNVDPMTAVIAKIENDNVYVFDEIFLRPGNTEAFAKELRARYPNQQIHIHPDNTGKHRSTNADLHQTDITILQQSQYGFIVHNRPKNYDTIDRYATVNRFLRDSLGNIRLWISPTCKYLIKDLEQVSYKEGKREIDPSNKLLTHISDALGYMVTGYFSIVSLTSQKLRAANKGHLEKYMRGVYAL